MKINYRYTPFNILSVVISIPPIYLLIKDFSFEKNFFLIFTAIGIALWLFDYYLQKKKVDFLKLFLFELIICLFLVGYFINGLVNNF